MRDAQDDLPDFEAIGRVLERASRGSCGTARRCLLHTQSMMG